MKKIISLFLALLLVIGIVPISSFAETLPLSEEEANTTETINMGFFDWSTTAAGAGENTTCFPYQYNFGKTYDQRKKVVPRISDLGEGFGGSYALKLGGEGVLVEAAGGSTGTFGYRVGFRYTTLGYIKDTTEYTFKVKLKKIQGTVSTFSIGFSESGTAHYSNVITDDMLTGEWQEFSWNYTTDFGGQNAASTRAIVYITYTAPDCGGTILVDDLVIYESADTKKANKFPQGGFEFHSTAQAVAEKDNIKVICSPLPGNDFARLSEPSFTEGSYDFPRTYINSVDTEALAPKLEANAGFNKSYGMVLGGSTTSSITDYTVKFRFKPGHWKESTYKFSLKLKKLSGTVTSLSIGLNDSSNSNFILNLTDANLSSENWTEFTWFQSITETALKNWTLLEIKFSSPEGGAELVVDDLLITDPLDNPSKSLFYIYDDNGNASDASSFDKSLIFSDTEYDDRTPVFRYSHNRPVDKPEWQSYVANLEKSISGNYCLAFGFKNVELENPEEAFTSYVDFQLAPIGSENCTYKIKFAARLFGESIHRSYVRILRQDGGYEELVNLKAKATDEWTEFEAVWTDDSYYKDATAHLFLRFTFSTFDPGPNTGLLIDNIRVTQNELGENAPNIFVGGDFEIVDEDLPEIDWEANNTFWGEDEFDLSFMNSLPKNILAYGLDPARGANLFGETLNDDSLAFVTDYIIESNNLETAIYTAKAIAAKNKNIWLLVDDIVNTDKVLNDNWKQLLMQYATHMQLIAGEKFQGFYFDEPSMDFNREDFSMVTKYCRTTFKKRVLAIHKSAAVNPDANYTNPDNRAILEPETHRYVTDVGYWKYDSWSPASAATLNVFKEKITSSDYDPNMRKWVVPIIGRSHPCQTEEDICELIENTVYGAMDMPGFGGVGLYAMYHSIKEISKTDPEAQGINENADKLLSEGIIWEGTDALGQETWKFLEAGGAMFLTKDEKTGLVPWQNCLDLIKEIAADLYGTTLHNTDSLLGVALLDTTDKTVTEFTVNAELPEDLFVIYRNGLALDKKDTLRTGDRIMRIGASAWAYFCDIAVKNDVNCDGKITAVDIVRAKRMSAGLADTSLAQRAALGMESETADISVNCIATLRKELMK